MPSLNKGLGNPMVKLVISISGWYTASLMLSDETKSLRNISGDFFA
jgi:hypothetical protein